MSIWDKLKESIVIGTVVAAPTVSSQQVKASVADKKQEAKEYVLSKEGDKRDQALNANVEYMGEKDVYVSKELIEECLDGIDLAALEARHLKPGVPAAARWIEKEFLESEEKLEYKDLDSSINKLTVLNYNDLYQKNLQKMSSDKDAKAFVEAYEENYKILNKNKILSEANVDKTLRFSTLDNFLVENSEVKDAMHKTLINGVGGLELNMKYRKEKRFTGQTEYTLAYETMLKEMKKEENRGIFKKDRVSSDANRIEWEKYSAETLDRAFENNPQMRKVAYSELYNNHKAEILQTMRNEISSTPRNKKAAQISQQMGSFIETDLLTEQMTQDKLSIVETKSKNFNSRGKTIDVDAYNADHLAMFIRDMERFEDKREQAKETKQEKIKATMAKIRRGHQIGEQEEQHTKQDTKSRQANVHFDVMAMKKVAKLSGYGD